MDLMGDRRRIRSQRLLLEIAWSAARRRLAALAGLLAAAAGVSAVSALVIKAIVNSLAGGHASEALRWTLVFLVMLAASTLAQDVAALLQFDLADRLTQEVDQRLMAVAAGSAGLDHLERPEFADRLNLISEHRYVPAEAVATFTSLLSVCMGLGIGTFLLGSIHPLLALFPLAIVPSSLLRFRYDRRNVAGFDDKAAAERMAQHLVQVTTSEVGAKEVRLLGLGPHLIARHKQLTDAYIGALLRDRLRRSGVGMLSGAVQGGALAGAIGFLGTRVIAGQATLGDLALGVQMVRLVLGQMTSAARTSAWLAELSCLGDRYLWLLDYKPSVVFPSGPQPAAPPDALSHGILLDDVSFNYPESSISTLQHVSLFLPAGRTIAVVGDNGAGKSTLAKLICRFYDPTEGRIFIEDRDLREYDLEALRSRISVCFQDFVRFQLRARDATGVGDLSQLDDLGAIRKAAREVGVEDVIDRLPCGFDTQLGRWFEGGVDLSEGEWQRVALSRAALRQDPLLLILDEPTASLDARTEHALFERFAELAAGAAFQPTTLLISHRFSTVSMADLIIVMESGRVTESGSHGQLMKVGGRYAELFGLQAAHYIDR